METATHPREGTSLVNLITGLREDVRDLFRQEVKLAKTELSEKARYFGRNGAYLLVGAVAGFLALIFLLLSIAFILAFAFEAAGISTGVALFLGFIAIALIVGVVGGVLAAKGISAFRKESLAPQKTMQTLQEITKGGLEQSQVTLSQPAPAPPDPRNSEEIRSDLEQTRSRIGREVRGIRFRLQFARMATGIVSGAKSHPGRWVGIGVGTGLASVVLMRVARLFGRKRTA